VVDNASETTQIAVQLAGIIQAQAASIAAHSKDIVTDVTGQLHTNASTKAPAHQAQHNAQAQDIRLAIQDVNGRIAVQTLIMMALTLNAAIHYAIIAQVYLTQQKHQLRMHAQIA